MEDTADSCFRVVAVDSVEVDIVVEIVEVLISLSIFIGIEEFVILLIMYVFRFLDLVIFPSIDVKWIVDLVILDIIGGLLS